MKFHLVVLSLLPFVSAQGNGQGGSGQLNPSYCSADKFLTERQAKSNLTSDTRVNCCLKGSSSNSGTCGDSSCTVFGFKSSTLSECTINRHCLTPDPGENCNRQCVGDKSGKEWTYYPYCAWEDPICTASYGNNQPSCWGYVKCENLNATVQVESTDCYGYGSVCLGSGKSGQGQAIRTNFKVCLGVSNSTSGGDGNSTGEGDEDCGFCAPDNAECSKETKRLIYDEGYFHKTIESCGNPDKIVSILNGYEGLEGKCYRSREAGCNNIICDAFVEPEIRASVDAIVDCPAPEQDVILPAP